MDRKSSLIWALNASNPNLYNYHKNILINSGFDDEQIGYSYECLLESTFTGYLMHCKGWKSVYLYPDRPCFLGCTTIDMKDALVQLMKWASGLVQVGLSGFSPLTYGVSRMPLLQGLCYGFFAFSHFISIACLLYGIVPPICFFYGIPLYPKVSRKITGKVYKFSQINSSCDRFNLNFIR